MERDNINIGKEIFDMLSSLSQEKRKEVVSNLSERELELLATYAMSDDAPKRVDPPKVRRPYKTPYERRGREFSEARLADAMAMQDGIHQRYMDRVYYSTPVYVAPDYTPGETQSFSESNDETITGEVPYSRGGDVIKHRKIEEHPMDGEVGPDGLSEEERRDITRKLRSTTLLLFEKANSAAIKDNPKIHR